VLILVWLTVWLTDWLSELQRKWKVVRCSIPNVNGVCAYQHLFFLNSKTILWENEEQDTVRFIGVSEHYASFFSVDDSSTLKMEAVRFSLKSVTLYQNIWRHIPADSVSQCPIWSVALDCTCFLTESVLPLPALNIVFWVRTVLQKLFWPCKFDVLQTVVYYILDYFFSGLHTIVLYLKKTRNVRKLDLFLSSGRKVDRHLISYVRQRILLNHRTACVTSIPVCCLQGEIIEHIQQK
jgi:hypothetical protein